MPHVTIYFKISEDNVNISYMHAQNLQCCSKMSKLVKNVQYKVKYIYIFKIKLIINQTCYTLSH